MKLANHSRVKTSRDIFSVGIRRILVSEEESGKSASSFKKVKENSRVFPCILGQESRKEKQTVSLQFPRILLNEYRLSLKPEQRVKSVSSTEMI